MLNLAQRLAIPPPPVRSRPSTSGPTISAGGNRERKDMQPSSSSTQNVGPEEKDLQSEGAGVASRPLNVESMTTRGHLLFGPWGDVGAMSTDDLRRRWKFSGMETSNATHAATLGAASASDLRSSWRDLQQMSRAFTYMRNEREVLGTPRQVSRDARATADVSSCSDEAEPRGNEVDSGECNFQVATPDSPCAGGSSLGELSSRWRALARVSSGRCSAGGGASDEISTGERSSSNKIASVDRKRIAELEIVPGQVFVDVSSAPSVLATSTRSPLVFGDDVGSLAGDGLQSRWRDAFKQGERDVGATEARALAARFYLASGAQGVGDMSNTDLTRRWIVSRSEETVGATEVGALAARFSLAIGPQGVGDISNADLTSRWTVSQSKETVGAMEVGALAARFSLASGIQGVGDTSIADLTKRWTAAWSKETVGATEVGALAARFSLASGAQGVGDMSRADLARRWTAAWSKETVGATEVGALAARFSLASGAQAVCVGDMSNADLTSRWIASRPKETVGATEVEALAARFSLTWGAQGVGDTSNADLTNRWIEARSKETVGATDVRALTARFSLTSGAKGVGDTPNADLTNRWTGARSKETVGATEVRVLAARFSLASGAQGVGGISNEDLRSRCTATRSTEERRGSSSHAGDSMLECNRLMGEQAVGAVSTSVPCKSWHNASDGPAPVG